MHQANTKHKSSIWMSVGMDPVRIINVMFLFGEKYCDCSFILRPRCTSSASSRTSLSHKTAPKSPTVFAFTYFSGIFSQSLAVQRQRKRNQPTESALSARANSGLAALRIHAQVQGAAPVFWRSQNYESDLSRPHLFFLCHRLPV